MAEGKSQLIRTSLRRLTPYELHKKLINEYVLTHKNATSLLQRKTARDKTDYDIIRENHKFLWNEDDEPETWEQRLAKKYYDKLFKEYCVCDLTLYKYGKVAMRWQTESELINGKGQFVCGSKSCFSNEGLKSWEVNFSYVENSEKKNALVKLRLCNDCSFKLNYKHQKKEVTSSKKRPLPSDDGVDNKKLKTDDETEKDMPATEKPAEEANSEEPESNVWKEPNVIIEEKSRSENFEEFLECLLL